MRDKLLEIRDRLMEYQAVAFIVYVLQSFNRHNTGRSAFYLAFTSLFAIVPMMTVVYSILSLIPELKGLESRMQGFVFEHFVPSTGSQLEEHLANFASQAADLTSIGVMMLFVTTVLMLRKIETSFNTIWHVTELRKGVNGFLLYWALLSLGPVMMGGTFAVSSYVISHKMVNDLVPLAGSQKFLLALLPILMSTVAFSLAYIAIPNTKVPIKHGLLGGLIAAILFDLARRAMTLFVALFPTYQLVYGAFAAVPLFLIWILVSWFILLIGAEIVQSMTNFSTKQQRTQSSLGNLLSILESLYQSQGKGEVIDEADFLERMPWIPVEQWENYTDMLIGHHLMHRSGEGAVSLTRDLHKYTLAQLFEDCYGQVLEIDLPTEKKWQKEVAELYHEGFNHCLDKWNITLADLFESRSPASAH